MFLFPTPCQSFADRDVTVNTTPPVCVPPTAPPVCAPPTAAAAATVIFEDKMLDNG
jgi:hypothetical protein